MAALPYNVIVAGIGFLLLIEARQRGVSLAREYYERTNQCIDGVKDQNAWAPPGKGNGGIKRVCIVKA